MEKVNTGLIGLGNFGELQTLILSQLPNVNLVALSSRTKSRVENIGKKFKIKKLYINYKDLLTDPDIEAVFICSDVKVHAEQALSAIDAGKHVFLEKPPAIYYTDAVQIVEAAKQSGIFLMIGYLYRFEACRAILKRYMDDGRFGRLIYMSFKNSFSRCWFDGDSKYSHPVHETMLHDIDLAIWYTQSRVKTVYAKQISVCGRKVPDACLATVAFESGVVASFETNWLIPDAAPLNLEKYNGTLDSNFEAFGTSMISRIRFINNGFALLNNDRIRQHETTLYPEVHGKVEGALRNELDHFIKCILKKEASSIASVDDAIYGMEVADAIVKSAQENRDVILS